MKHDEQKQLGEKDADKVARAIEQYLKTKKITYKIESADKGIIFDLGDNYKSAEDVQDIIYAATRSLPTHVAAMADITSDTSDNQSIFVDYR